MLTKTKEAKATTRDVLLSAPSRKWDQKSRYPEIFVVPSRKKHDSGWMLMVIVGRNSDGSLEQAAWCDDIEWVAKMSRPYSSMRNDCTFPGGILHFWNATFEVGVSLSSTKVTVWDSHD